MTTDTLTLLYHRRDLARAGYRVPRHRHAFWQIEVVLRGAVEMDVADRRWSLGQGQWLLIAPGSDHALRYKEDTRYLSLKFQAAELSEERADRPWPASPVLARLAALLTDALPEGEATPDPALPLEHALILALAEWRRIDAQQQSTPEQGPSDLLERAIRLVEEADGTMPSVKALAAELPCSADYLSAEYRRRKGKSLKSYLDFVRMRRAKAMLLYSERRIGDIASVLQFPDVYAFSRFFRRLSGQSPRAFRRDDP